MNIYELLKIIRDNNGIKGEFTIVAESIMDLYLGKRITCQTVLRMYDNIVHHMIMDSSCYGHHPRDSQGV